MFFDTVFEEPDQSWACWINCKKNVRPLFFYLDPNFSRPDPDLVLIRAWEENSYPDPEKRARIRNTG